METYSKQCRIPDHEIIAIARTEAGGGWAAVDQAIQQKLVAFGREMLRRARRRETKKVK